MEYFDCDEVMDAERYMKWDREDSERPDWHTPDAFLSASEIKYTEENIKRFEEMATLMSLDELDEFVEESLKLVKEKIK